MMRKKNDVKLANYIEINGKKYFYDGKKVVHEATKKKKQQLCG